MDAKVPGLDQLRDIVLPPTPPIWPPTPELGMLVLLILAAGLVIWAQWRRARRVNVYRTEGLKLLARAESVHELSVILKRVALAAFARAEVASLHGADWVAFLQRTGGGDFREIVESAPTAAPTSALVGLAAGWIRGHRRPAEAPGKVT